MTVDVRGPVEPITIPEMVSAVLGDADMPLNSIAVMTGVGDRYGVRVPHAEIKATLHDQASHGRAVRLTERPVGRRVGSRAAWRPNLG